VNKKDYPTLDADDSTQDSAVKKELFIIFKNLGGQLENLWLV
jgi:hypothetical protein